MSGYSTDVSGFAPVDTRELIRSSQRGTGGGSDKFAQFLDIAGPIANTGAQLFSGKNVVTTAVSAAFGGAGTLHRSMGGGPPAPPSLGGGSSGGIGGTMGGDQSIASTFEDRIQAMNTSQMEVMQVQMKVSHMSTMYQGLSNIEKQKTETSLNAIRNIRS